MGESRFAVRCKQVLMALCASGALLAAPADADDARRHGHNAARHDKHLHSDRHRDHRRHDRHHHRVHERHDWHYHDGRYWAPPRHRGRYCDDHRHYRGVHYHVAAHDYYEYYYPRYRPLYGYAPSGADATVIITLPLF